MPDLTAGRPRRWVVYNKKDDFRGIAAQLGISQVLARIIRNRDVTGAAAMEGFLYCPETLLHDPKLLPDAEKAAEVIERSIRAGEKIRIVGDYDVDGICSAFILWRALRAMGGDADTVLPHRIRDGYGISERIVREAAADGVKLIVTCDNGIAAAAPLETAAELGLTVVVTDHHEIPYNETEEGRQYVLPRAAAVVDPKRPSEDGGAPAYPYPEICGAAVAWKLCTLLGDRFPEREALRSRAYRTELEAFCGLATVCDVMPLRDENRVMVKRGLLAAAETDNVGMRSLIDVNGLRGTALRGYHAGFILGPCLNATGRLDSAETALGMFQETDPSEALRTAQMLRDLNDNRKTMTAQGVERAREQVLEQGMTGDRVLVIYLPDCHESLAGIIAGKIKEQFYRPTFVLTSTERGEVKGSGRSVEAYHMYDALNRCSDLLIRFGGHAMAAGLTLAEENIDAFRRRLNDQCGLTEQDLTETVRIDMELPPGLLTERIVGEFEMLEPCGTRNPRPLLVTRSVRLQRLRAVGRNRNVLRLSGTDSAGRRIEMVHFCEEGAFREQFLEACPAEAYERLISGHGDVCIDAVYSPEIHEWNGQRQLQFTIRDFRFSRREG